MKKFYLIAFLFGLLFVSCTPEKDVYNQLDAAKQPYHTSIGYTLTAADYSTISKYALTYCPTTHADSAYAKQINTYLSFGYTHPVSNYTFAMSKFFATTFLAYNAGSTIALSYDYTDFRTLVTGNTATTTQNYYVYTATDGTVPIVGAAGITSKILPYISSKLVSLTPVDGQMMVVEFPYQETTASATETRDAFFYYDGIVASAWLYNNSKGYALTLADYALMGNGTGQPGATNYFSGTVLPANYIPKLLKNKFPEAVAGDTRYISYKDYSLTETHLDLYSYDGTNWKDRTTLTTQYAQTGTSWFPDPTIHLTMAKSDYQMLVDYAGATTNDSIKGYYDYLYKDDEFWYGASAYYGEFQFKVASRTGSYTASGVLYPQDPFGLYHTSATDKNYAAYDTPIFNAHLQAGLCQLLSLKYPTLKPLDNGIQVYVVVTYVVYTGATVKYTCTIKCIGVGQFLVVPSTYTSVSAV